MYLTPKSDKYDIDAVIRVIEYLLMTLSGVKMRGKLPIKPVVKTGVDTDMERYCAVLVEIISTLGLQLYVVAKDNKPCNNEDLPQDVEVFTDDDGTFRQTHIINHILDSLSDPDRFDLGDISQIDVMDIPPKDRQH